ncbi:MAG: hypothetical protein ACR2GY_06020 [Phycisphaerales bacterium]
MHVRIGDILLREGRLTTHQVHEVLAAQLATGEPFGLLCEKLFNLPTEYIEEAWQTQYIGMAQRIDPLHEMIDNRALGLITRRQAWQFRVLPIRFDDRELMLATTSHHLRRALRFATRCLGVPVYLVIAESRPLGEALCRHYPIAGMTPASIDDDAMDRLLGMGRSSAA